MSPDECTPASRDGCAQSRKPDRRLLWERFGIHLSTNDVSVDRVDSPVPRPTLDLSMALAHTDPPRTDGRGALHVQARVMKFTAAAGGTPVVVTGSSSVCWSVRVGRCMLHNPQHRFHYDPQQRQTPQHSTSPHAFLPNAEPGSVHARPRRG